MILDFPLPSFPATQESGRPGLSLIPFNRTPCRKSEWCGFGVRVWTESNARRPGQFRRSRSPLALGASEPWPGSKGGNDSVCAAC
jgi:hypothetical protein